MENREHVTVGRASPVARAGLGTTCAVVAVAAAYYGGNHVGFALTPAEEAISPLWPPNAILLAALLLAPRRLWPAFLLAALPAHLLVQLPHGVPVPTSLGWYVTNTAEAVLAALCIRRFVKPEQLFTSMSGMMAFIGFGVILAPVVTSFVDAGIVVGTARGEDYWILWRARLFSNMLANLMFVPPIVTVAFIGRASLRQATRARVVEAAALTLAIPLVALALFGSPNQSPGSLPLLIYALLPLLLWAAVRFGPAGLSVSILAAGFLLIWNATHGRGPFTSPDIGDTVNSVQLLLGVLAVPLLALAVVIQERVRAQSLQSAVLASLPDRVAIVDPNGVIIAVNDAWLSFARSGGVSSLESVRPGADYLEVCRRAAGESDEMAAKALRGIEGVLNGSLPRFQQEYAWPAPPHVLWFRLSAEPLQRPEGGAVITHTDVTSVKASQLEALRLRQELAHASRVMTVGELSGALAHELNQPLTSIIANAQAGLRVLNLAPPNLTEVGDVLGDIVAAGRRAGEVIHRVRALMRPGAAQAQTLDINVVVEEVLDLVHSDLVGRGVMITTQLAAPLPPVRGDRVQLQQVLLNLILNACDAMTATAADARRVTIVTMLAANGFARVSIADQGTGIPEEDLERVFEPFFSSKENRLGLGLSICRSIVVAHNGRLWATARPQGGAVFHFDLPAETALTYPAAAATGHRAGAE